MTLVILAKSFTMIHLGSFNIMNIEETLDSSPDTNYHAGS